MSSSHSPATDSSPPQGRWVRWMLWLILPLVIGGVLGVVLMLQSIQSEPEFYQRAAQQLADPVVRRAAAAEFQQRRAELQTAVRRSSEWSVTFTQPQINAWLADEFPRNRGAGPPGATDAPLVELQAGAMLIGSRVEIERFRGVVSISLRPRLGDDATLILEIESIRAGDVPLPPGRWLDSARLQLASRSGVQLVESPQLQIVLSLSKLDPSLRGVTITGFEVSPDGLKLSGRRRGGL